MVIVKLYGGLGNQMYQYAAGKALALKIKTNLYLDDSWFVEIKGNKDVTQRVFELQPFGIEKNPLSLWDRISLKASPLVEFKESKFGYNKDFRTLKGNVVLDGYWQSYKYFDDYAAEIRTTFKFPKLSGDTRKLLERINSVNSISLHVRRGDYVTRKSTNDFHGVLGNKYYLSALKKIVTDVKDPYVFIFSDDPQWCRQNLKVPYKAYYQGNGDSGSGVNDMHLMSACKHHIIANSSFSWWAAWLDEKSEKKVAAPGDWFRQADAGLKDRLPKSWIKI
jgi:hypothetical protein